MPSHRGRQKQIEKRKRKRDDAKRRANAPKRGGAPARGPSPELVARAASYPFGPAFLSGGWRDLAAPALVTVVLTRELPDGRLLPLILLVDRTCLGVKSAHTPAPLTMTALQGYLDHIGEMHGGVERCDPAVAQSVVFHALDYARALGFEPPADFPAALVEPRPAPLHDTPWARPPRPIYASGPYDDAAKIIARLDAAVGAGNYDATLGGLFDELDLGAAGFDVLEGGEDDEDVLEGEGEVADEGPGGGPGAR